MRRAVWTVSAIEISGHVTLSGMASSSAFPPLRRGWASDLEVLAVTGSEVSDRGDHLVVRTPGNPYYRWGNLLVVRDPARRNDAAHWVDRFTEELPAAGHRSIGLPAAPDPAPWTGLGLKVESDEVLTAPRPPQACPLAEGYAVRRLVTDADWAGAVELEIADEITSTARGGVVPSEAAKWAYRRFAERRWAARAAASAGDALAFFGAYRDGRQVAHLGIVRCSDHARYQSVQTHLEHRRRGLAAHLLAVAGAWGADQGASSWVILVEPGSAAARLYRSVGFTFDSLTWQISADE